MSFAIKEDKKKQFHVNDVTNSKTKFVIFQSSSKDWSLILTNPVSDFMQKLP